MNWIGEGQEVSGLSKTNHQNIYVRGYIERGNITTPMELAIQNEIDRFTLAIDVSDQIPKLQAAGARAKKKFRNMQIGCRRYASRTRYR